MDEPYAWLNQAGSDYRAAEILHSNEDVGACHALAKFQQTSEKSIKPIVAALNDAGLITVAIGYRHEVERFISLLIRLRGSDSQQMIGSSLRKLLDERTRGEIRAIDALVPRRPRLASFTDATRNIHFNSVKATGFFRATLASSPKTK